LAFIDKIREKKQAKQSLGGTPSVSSQLSAKTSLSRSKVSFSVTVAAVYSSMCCAVTVQKVRCLPKILGTASVSSGNAASARLCRTTSSDFVVISDIRM